MWHRRRCHRCADVSSELDPELDHRMELAPSFDSTLCAECVREVLILLIAVYSDDRWFRVKLMTTEPFPSSSRHRDGDQKGVKPASTLHGSDRRLTGDSGTCKTFLKMTTG